MDSAQFPPAVVRHAIAPIRIRWLRALTLACIVAAILGCSKSSRLAVEGVVTVDGQPLPAGKISFIPLPGTASPTAGATITNGRFKVDSAKGLHPGTFRVEIRAVRKTGKLIKDDVTGGAVEQMESFIPDRYNEKSTLVAEVKVNEANRLEYNLGSK